jgi:hypothetical protein
VPDPMSAKLVAALDDTRPSATPAQPEPAVVGDRETVSALKSVVSRVGIEPTTRRLRERLAPVRRLPPRIFALILSPKAS